MSVPHSEGRSAFLLVPLIRTQAMLGVEFPQPMQIGETAQYKEAFQALERLRQQHGSTPELQAIARLMLYANPVEIANRSPFAWVGTADPRDRAVVQAMEEAWKIMISGEGDDDD